MGFFKQFEDFDPLTGSLPSSPFSYMPDIAWRARALLKSYTAKQISWIAEDIDWAIEEYFRDVKKEEIDRLQRDLICLQKWKSDEWDEEDEAEYQKIKKFFHWKGDQENGAWVFNKDFEDELDIPTADSASEVDALKECISYLNQLDGEDELPKIKPFEYFAVLSLWLLADALSWLSNKHCSVRVFYQLPDDSKTIDIQKYPIHFSVSIGGEFALKAMDAVCHAEHLCEIEKRNQAYLVELAQKQSDFQIELARQQEEDRQRKSERAMHLNKLRHKKRDEAKARVLDEWLKDKNKFNSAEKAGLYFADWLPNQGYEKFEPRTVTKWIRDEAKQKGICFR